MNSSSGEVRDPRNTELHQKDTILGFRIKRSVRIQETESYAYELEHEATGAKYFHISTDDMENTFAVGFKTVPFDSTGVAHILEHTALCGSQKYPVRDPFFSMLKRSLSSFMNAFTASDWTMYPFTTQNRKDYYNLMDVYLDAAFFPNLDELAFKQEGHRLEFSDRSDQPDSFELQYKGVVYNEMKGAMSSPREVMSRSLSNALYPSTTYRYNSGGDPAEIPELTHERLVAFHRRFYHPSNAFFYTYGNLPLKDHLGFIKDKVLCGFERIDPQTEVPLQPRWHAPKQVTYTYPLGGNEDPQKKSQVCVAWLTADIKNTFEILILTLLELVLLGNAASPLRKALIDSGMGTALSDRTGFDPDNRDTLFSCGLKDVKSSDAEKIEAIVFEVIKDLVEKGIDKRLVESAIHQIEFHRKEITGHPYPYGIKLLLSFCGSWFHGGDPMRILNFDADIEKIRALSADTPFLENKLKQYFLENPHRIRLTLEPDPHMQQKENERVSRKLKRIQQGLTDQDLEKIKKDTEILKRLQESEADISCLPSLAVEDISPEIQRVIESTANPAFKAARYQQPTSGIFYFLSVSGAKRLTDRMLPLVPFFCYCFPKIGTKRHDYVEMARRIDTYTGGIGLASHARTRYTPATECAAFISLNGKCLKRNQNRMFDLIEEMIHMFDCSDLARLKNLLLEYRASLESMVVQNGHRLAMSLASRTFSLSGALNEIWHGIHQLQTVKGLTENLNEDKLKSISEDLTSIGKLVFSGTDFQMALVGEASALDNASSFPDSVLSGFEASANTPAFNPGNDFTAPEIERHTVLPREGWSTSTAVSFVAQAFETVRMDHPDAPALAVIGKMIRSLYLHREIREKGGAYGGFAVYNVDEGVFSFASYRDPHIVPTLSVFNDAFSFITSGNYSDQDIHEAILQVCAEIDKPDTPAVAAQKAFYRKIIALSDELREKFKQEVLKLTRSQVIQAARKYFDPKRAEQAVAVISSEEKLKAANDELSDYPLTLHRI